MVLRALLCCFDTLLTTHLKMSFDYAFENVLRIPGSETILIPEPCARFSLEQEIDDMVMMGNDTRIFHTAALEPSELNAYCTDESPAPQVSLTCRLSCRHQ